MLNMLTNLTKAAVAAVATPVALVVDVLTLPASSLVDTDREPFSRTDRMMKRVGDCINEATNPERQP